MTNYTDRLSRKNNASYGDMLTAALEKMTGKVDTLLSNRNVGEQDQQLCELMLDSVQKTIIPQLQIPGNFRYVRNTLGILLSAKSTLIDGRVGEPMIEDALTKQHMDEIFDNFTADVLDAREEVRDRSKGQVATIQ